MSIKKLLVAAAVIAGSSSAALAHPNRHETYRHEADRREAYRHGTYHHETYRQPWAARRYYVQPRVTYRYYDTTPTYVAPTYVAPTYVEPTYVEPSYVPQTYASPGFINGQLFIPLSGYGREIQLQMTNGPAFVDRVEVRYADGRTQMIHVDAHLDATNPVFDLPIEGYGVTGVTLIGEGSAVTAVPVQ